MSKNVIELPPNYGLNYLDLAVREFGRIGSLILKGIFHSFDIFDRLNVRSVLDSYGGSRSYKPRVMTISSQSHVAVCKLYHDQSVLISASLSTCNFTITMSHKISCIRFLNAPNDGKKKNNKRNSANQNYNIKQKLKSARNNA